jgi:hypothetical protein
MKRYTLAGLLIVAVLFVAGWTFQTAPTRAKWEYKSITVDYAGTPTAADALGADGWELVSVVNFDAKVAGMRNTTFYFKRQK